MPRPPTAVAQSLDGTMDGGIRMIRRDLNSQGVAALDIDGHRTRHAVTGPTRFHPLQYRDGRDSPGSYPRSATVRQTGDTPRTFAPGRESFPLEACVLAKTRQTPHVFLHALSRRTVAARGDPLGAAGRGNGGRSPGCGTLPITRVSRHRSDDGRASGDPLFAQPFRAIWNKTNR